MFKQKQCAHHNYVNEYDIIVHVHVDHNHHHHHNSSSTRDFCSFRNSSRDQT
jgi:hypothetical protein